MEATPGHGNYKGAITKAAAVSTTKGAAAIDKCPFLEPLATIRLTGR
jgi:hypothetical protein